MNKRKVLSSLQNIADNLDSLGKTKDADSVTCVMRKIASDENYFDNEMMDEFEDPLFMAIKDEVRSSDLGLDERAMHDLAEELYDHVIRRIEESRVKESKLQEKFKNMAEGVMNADKNSKTFQGKMRDPNPPYFNLPDPYPDDTRN